MLPPIFNCSNDMALAANLRQYQPPKLIQQMESDLAGLAACWDEGPWGWSLAARQRYRAMGIADDKLPCDEWLANVRRLSSREFACGYIAHLLDEFATDKLVGRQMRFLRQVAPFAVSDGPMIFKSPWSSSGRGVFVAESFDSATAVRLQGYVSRQGGFAADKFYTDKTLDFALEFCVHPDHTVDFLGYSIFHAAEHGAYGYNIVDCQQRLRERIAVDASLLDSLIDYHKRHLAHLGYTGPVGIDMMLLADGRVHPCIEINLRMNMGILAINLFNRFGPAATVELTPPRLHGFQARIDNGRLAIVYKK